jgi:hypothetical protein
MTQRDYGRKPYISTKRYPEFIRTHASKGIWDRVTESYPNLAEYDGDRNKLSAAEIALVRYIKQSELKKPYGNPKQDYKEMEYEWEGPPGINWPSNKPPVDQPWELQLPPNYPAMCFFDLECEDEYCPNDTTSITVTGTNPIYWVQTTLEDDPATHIDQSSVKGYGTNKVTFDLIAGDESGPINIESSMTCFEGLTGDSNAYADESDECTGIHFADFRFRGKKQGVTTSQWYAVVVDVESGKVVFSGTSAAFTTWRTGKGWTLKASSNIWSKAALSCGGSTDMDGFCNSPPQIRCGAGNPCAVDTSGSGTLSYDTKAACAGAFKKGDTTSSSWACRNEYGNGYPTPCTHDANWEEGDYTSGSVDNEDTDGFNLYSGQSWTTATVSFAANMKITATGMSRYDHQPCSINTAGCDLTFKTKVDNDATYVHLSRYLSMMSYPSPTTIHTGGKTISSTIGSSSNSGSWKGDPNNGVYKGFQVGFAGKFVTWTNPSPAGYQYASATVGIIGGRQDSFSNSDSCGSETGKSFPDCWKLCEATAQNSAALDGNLDPIGGTNLTAANSALQTIYAQIQAEVGESGSNHIWPEVGVNFWEIN